MPQARSLLSQFSGDVGLVRRVLETSNEAFRFPASSKDSRTGISKHIYLQQQRNMGNGNSGSGGDVS